METSNFGSDFVALTQFCEYIRGLQYKLRMMGIPVEDPTFVNCDNQSLATNSSLPEYKIAKKSNYIAYHFVREGSAKYEWMRGRVGTDDNPSDLMTESPVSEDSCIRKVRILMYDI